MTTSLEVDLNARTADHAIRLTTVGARDSLDATKAGPGDWVWLRDDEITVGAVVEDTSEGLVARLAWETMEEAPEGDPNPTEVRKAIAELQSLVAEPVRDYRRIRDLLPLAEHGLQPGRAQYLRSRIAEAFGYAKLALRAVEDAIEAAGELPSFRYQRLTLLRRVDPERAYEEVWRLAQRGQQIHPLLTVAGVEVLSQQARSVSEPDATECRKAIIDISDGFERRIETAPVPASARAQVHVLRGFAYEHLGRRKEAASELDLALKAAPRPEAFAARGLHNYPSEQAVSDFHRAVELGFEGFYPSYYLAHFYMCRAEWETARTYIESALRAQPPDPVRGNLLEWKAIVEIKLGGDPVAVIPWLREAAELTPDAEHVGANLALAEQLATEPTRSEGEWTVAEPLEADITEIEPMPPSAAA